MTFMQLLVCFSIKYYYFNFYLFNGKKINIDYLFEFRRERKVSKEEGKWRNFVTFGFKYCCNI